MLLTANHLCYGQYTAPIDTTNPQIVTDTNKTSAYLVPDVPQKWVNWTQYDGKRLSFKIGAVLLLDYTAFFQNDSSKAQVSTQQNKLELRAARLMFSGLLKFKNPWQYFISAEFRGFARDTSENAFGLTDAYLTIPLGKADKYGKLTIGKIKETHIYEMVGDAVNIPQTERILNPFFVSRNIGIRYMFNSLQSRMTYSVGWFNDGWVTGVPLKESGNDFTVRITGLPVLSSGGDKYLHLGASMRYIGADYHSLRYRGKVESNVSDYYVDTKSMDASHAWNLAGEFLYTSKSYSVTAEWVQNWTTADISTLSFNCWNIVASWVLTGENRPYDKTVAYARRIMPKKKSGAWELVARFSRLDLQDKSIDGGILNKWHMGVNWWATQHWRVSVAYGISTLDRFNKTGLTNQVLTRLQWVL
ncbi:OprO/OprP family phosphate-selective porin [Chitinophaga arvensicola]|uniref:Phosphate-selective porin n=1 Tax=Chitinophaga arvensicola TaxID=29529 RepID=A0A1I0R7Z4_9BACT|nr:porin [Chitinophaga arvensicola]SEW36827.1 Phosphate-selective porin [Chitinophaga arvensicola]